MKRTATAAIGIACTAALVGALAQSGTPQPGQPTQAKVWIQNRAPSEAVPVAIERVSPAASPLRVHVDGVSVVTLDPSSVVRVRPSPAVWEYEILPLDAGDPATILNAAGADGWEVSGVLPHASGVQFVMKRRR